MKLYRGTQSRELGGVRKMASWTPSLPVGVIYSARPGDPWGSKSKFLPTSTVHVGELTDDHKVLRLCAGGYGTYCSFREVLLLLEYGEPDGITDEEAKKILNYMHNRLTGRAKGGEFLVKVVDEDGIELEEDDLPFSLRNPYTVVRAFRDEFDSWGLDVAEYLEADAFIYADAPKFLVAAQRLGYDAVSYEDVFLGGTYAARDLLGCDVEDLQGVEENEDLEGNDVPTHETIRPIRADVIDVDESVPVSTMLPIVTCEGVAQLKEKLLR